MMASPSSAIAVIKMFVGNAQVVVKDVLRRIRKNICACLVPQHVMPDDIALYVQMLGISKNIGPTPVRGTRSESERSQSRDSFSALDPSVSAGAFAAVPQVG
jgi:hypothetical protein